MFMIREEKLIIQCAMTDDIKFCAADCASESLESRVCLVDNSFDGSGVDGCDGDRVSVAAVSGGIVGEVRTAVVGEAALVSSLVLWQRRTRRRFLTFE